MAYRAVRTWDRMADRWFDVWRGLDNLVALGGTPSYYGLSHANGVFTARLSHWTTRPNALGAALRVILSDPHDEAAVSAAYMRAVATIPNVSEEHLPVLLWYRDALFAADHAVESKSERDDAQCGLLHAMITVIGRDLWSKPMTPRVLDLVEQWRTLVAAGARIERPPPMPDHLTPDHLTPDHRIPDHRIPDFADWATA